MIFYTSDTHFHHENVIRYCNRPFKDVEEMNEHLIKVWNKRVNPTDTVFHLGDVLFGGDDKLKLLGKLNGQKTLILGNHDQRFKRSSLLKYFGEVTNIKVIFDPVLDCHVSLLHYPMESWPHMYHNAVHIHGHCHGTLDRKMARRFDVGVDCHPNFEPFSSEDILRLLK